MEKHKRKNSENARMLSTMLVNWVITCAALFYPALCASAFYRQSLFTFLLTIFFGGLFANYFVTYILQARDTRTSRMLPIFITGVVWYVVISYVFFCGM